MNCNVEEYRIGHQILTVEIGEGDYCSKWGLTDLYEDCEKNLRDLLKTGIDFRTEWCGSKKELLSARYRREDGKVWVDVNEWMDDLWDDESLIYDAVWERLHTEDIEIPDDGIAFIRQIAIEMGIDDTIVISEELGVDATYEDCMAAVERLEDKTDEQLTAWYEELCNIVEDYVRNEGLDKKGDE